jgi:hypothetical protein
MHDVRTEAFLAVCKRRRLGGSLGVLEPHRVAESKRWRRLRRLPAALPPTLSRAASANGTNAATLCSVAAATCAPSPTANAARGAAACSARASIDTGAWPYVSSYGDTPPRTACDVVM